MVKKFFFKVKMISQLIQIIMGKISGEIEEQQERNNLCVFYGMYGEVSP